MRRFMMGWSLFWLWIACGTLAYGFTNAYYIFVDCNPKDWTKRPGDTSMAVPIIMMGPVALIVEVPRTGFGLYGFSYNPGCPVKE